MLSGSTGTGMARAGGRQRHTHGVALAG
eukprot:SAG25_NODE_14513_length_254_cov_0.664516_1_plen_27_part_01